MDAMRADMGGAATVCASIVTAAALKLPVNIIGGLLSVHPLLSGSILVYLEKHHPCFCFDQVWPRCVRTCPVERPPNQEFVTAPHWAHLDIAGVMSNKDEVPYLRKGMSGRPTRTLVEFAAGLAHSG
ncbi:hypothetical protein XENOCAPTIV_029559 [Xenoophorus captivus]|uniref:Cytosol aminopeptidase domain-containing protein n=1 Tax=Xenoophorus captivus TaxID=1517983 RepID=A0ABV0RVW4_9TELE